MVEDCYTPEEKAEARRRKLFGVGGGVALLVLGMFMPGMLQSIQMFSFCRWRCSLASPPRPLCSSTPS